MRFILITLFFVTALATKTHAQTETSRTGNMYYIKIANGMNALYTPITTSTDFEISLHVKTGSMYDPDSSSGLANILQTILAEKVASNLRAKKGLLNFSNTRFTSYSTTEHAVYKLSSENVNLVSCLNLLRDSVLSATFSNREIELAVQTVINDFTTDSLDPKKVFDTKILSSVFRQDLKKMNTKGNEVDLWNIDKRALNAFYTRYYGPNNTIMAASGNLSYSTFNLQFERSYINLIKSEFDPKLITQIIDLRPMVYTTQFIIEQENTAPEFTLAWQFPGTSSDVEASYCAYLLSAILNDPNNFIRIKAAKLGCKKFTVEYDANSFSGMLRVLIQPDKTNLMATLNLVRNEMARLEKTLVNESMMTAGKYLFKKEYEQLKASKEYPEWVIKHWAYKDESYFPSLGDSLMQLTEKKMRSFTIEYLSRSPQVTGLLITPADRAALQVDSQFTNIDEKVVNYEFKYRMNITDLEGEENLNMRRNLLQFLSINKDVNAQINGLADEGEYNQAVDDTISQFIDSLPTFRRTMPEKIKKGYLKPEMMRAIKIVKFLYDNGIAADRLTGTSMKFSSTNKTEEQENMKCSITLDKLRKSISLYEFYYGKSKPPTNH